MGPCPNICLSVCLSVCLSEGYSTQFSTYGLENLDLGPPHHWEEAFSGIFQNFDFKDSEKNQVDVLRDFGYTTKSVHLLDYSNYFFGGP